MTTRIVIRIQGGIIQFIGANTENVSIKIMDEDLPGEYKYEDYEPDSIMTDEGLQEFIDKQS